jgi:hypothetical protein
MQRNKKFLVTVVGVFALAAFLLLLTPSARSTTRAFGSVLYAKLSSPASEQFPSVDTTTLSEVQQRIIMLARQEYAKRPVSYDKAMLVYSEGYKEPWCADFVSWVMKEAGAPYSNPHSGHWRIPGVLTLREYYQSQERYISSNAGYTPRIGDVAIYIGEKTLDGRSSQHTNIVIKVEGDQMLTIGGNERGRMRISKQNFKGSANSLVGFGLLQTKEN